MKRLISRIPGSGAVLDIIATATVKDSAITFGGTFINGLLGAVFYILAARFLGPSGFGLLTVAIAVMTLVSDVGDLGTDTGLVNFVARYIRTNLVKVKKFLKLALQIKLGVASVVLIAGFFLSPFLASFVFAKPELTLSLRIAFVGVGALLAFSFVNSVLQALQKFWIWSGLQVGTNGVRVVLLFILLAMGVLTIEKTMWIYILTPLMGFLVGVFFLPRGFMKVKGQMSVSREFFKYNQWVAAFTLVAALASRVDTFISARLLTSHELGIYSAAGQLVKIVPQLVVALGTVMAPKMAAMTDAKAMLSYLKKSQIFVFVLVIVGVAFIPLVLYLITPIFGQEYLASGPVFIVLFFAMLIFLFSVPVHMAVFYYFSYPKLFFWLSLVSLTAVITSGLYLIANFGVMGAAVSVLIGQIINFVVPAAWVYKKIRKGLA